MPDDLSLLRQRSTRKFATELASHGLSERVVELPESTRTAADAARAIGCDVRQIVKSLVFRVGVGGEAVLVLVSGRNRVDEAWMARYVGAPLIRADPEFVRSVSGYAIGGVPPVGHPAPLTTYVDYDLLELPEVWAAAGHPNAVCRLTSQELLRLTGARAVPVVPLSPPNADPAPWVTFDCYGTLVDWREGFVRALDRVGIGGSTSDQDRLFQSYLREEQSIERRTYRSYREVMTDALVGAAQAAGFDVSRARAQELPETISSWPLFPETRDVLRALHDRGTRLAVLSNIDRDLLERTVADHHLPIDLLVTAEDVRSYKPAPPHWIRFLQQTGVSSSDVLHVSSSYEYDIDTARALGFRTGYVSRYGPPPPGRAVGVVMPSLQDLVQ